MPQFKVEILLPLRYNREGDEAIGKLIDGKEFHDTYEQLLEKFGGISSYENRVNGSWVSPETKKRYDDESVIFSVVLNSEQEVQKIKEYKEVLKIRFKQEDIFMTSMVCEQI